MPKTQAKVESWGGELSIKEVRLFKVIQFIQELFNFFIVFLSWCVVLAPMGRKPDFIGKTVKSTPINT